jgi:hypothetical protein
MVKKLLIALPIVLALSVAIMFLPAKQMDIEGIGRLSLETKITLSVGSEVAYAAPDDTGWQSPSAYENNTLWFRSDLMYTSNNRRGWTNRRGEDAATTNLYNFNLSGISGTIEGIEVDIEANYRPIQALPMTHRVRARLMWNGRSLETSYQETPEVTTSDAYYTLGGPTDTWGRSWTADDFTNANFAIRVSSNMTGGQSGRSDQLRVDHVRVRVYYTAVVPPTCWLCGWGNRVRLTIDHNDVDAPLTDFPVLLYLSTSSGRNNDDVSFIFDELQSDANRHKIAVTTSDCVECYVEIEKWDQASEQAWLWVKVPSISDTTDTELHLYYDSSYADNTAYVGDTDSTPAQNVWDDNFALVQHLGEDATVVHDSTANNNDETNPPPPPPSGDPDPGYVRATYTDSGNTDGGYSFSNGSRLQMNHSSSLDITENITLETFVYLNDRTDGKFIAKDDPFPGGAGCYCLQQEANNLELMLDFGGWYRASYGFYNTGEWLYVAGTYDRQTMRFYLNGVERATNPQTSPITSYDTLALALGNRAYDVDTYYDLNGLLDEIRISDATRSAAWIRASRESGIDDLIAFGSEETITEDIVNAPSEIDFGPVVQNSSYWSNGSVPTFPLDDGDCYFMVTNNSDCPVDIEIRATDFSGGVGWTLVSTDPPWNDDEVRLKAGRSGDAAEGNMVILTITDQPFITGLDITPPNNTKRWEIKLETGTFSDGVEKTSTITLTATFA